ncbi:MAG: hypothetical protein JOY80_08730 [Candidatus Dormibacteraeota bacterium]|nr:hypothetical protein [Candidatus Dormibacteraeota bacterium]
MNGKVILAGAAASGALLLAACGSPSPSAGSGSSPVLIAGPGNIVGTWIDTVTPNAPGGPFQSTLVFTNSGAVIEATSKAFAAPTTDISAGLGVWQPSGHTVEMTFHKYRFNSSGQYIGTTVIIETDTLQSADAYSGKATTSIEDTLGHVLTSFTSTTSGQRMVVPGGR